MKHFILRQLNPRYWFWTLLPFFILTILGLSFVLLRGCSDKEVSRTVCNEEVYSVDSVIICNSMTQSGAVGMDQRYRVELGKQSGEVWVSYDMYDIPDEIMVLYNGKKVHNSGMVNGVHQFSFTYKGSKHGPSYCDVIIQAPDYSTGWEFTVFCPGTQPSIPSY